jgi:two-component system NtrC family sensor kinase
MDKAFAPERSSRSDADSQVIPHRELSPPDGDATGFPHGERLLRSVIQALDAALCIVGFDGKVLDVNSRWPAPVGSDFFAWCETTPDLAHLLPDVASAVRDLAQGSSPPPTGMATAVKGEVGKAETHRWVVLRVHPIRDHELACAVVTMTDITEGMRLQEDLRRATEESQRMALVARATESAVAITDPDGVIEWVNDPFSTQTGLLPAEAVGHRRSELIDPDCRQSQAFKTFLTYARSHGAKAEFALRSRSGRTYWAEIEVRPVRVADEISHFVWIEQDITARRLTQQRLTQATRDAEQLTEALDQETSLLSGVISTIPQLVYWKDELGHLTGCNRAFLRWFGVDDVSLLPALYQQQESDSFLAALRTLEESVVRTGQPVLDHRVDLPDDDGRTRSLLLSVLPLDLGPHEAGNARAVMGVGADVTHVRDLEHQLAQTNRLESLGQLASGVAHEINTPVQFIADNTRFVTETISELLAALSALKTTATDSSADQLRAALEQIDLEFLQVELLGALADSREGLERVAEIVRAMKDYARPSRSRSDVDVNRAIETTVRVCRNEWKYVAEIDLDLDPDADTVPAYEGELKQVILNMVVNAAQAIAADPHRSSDSPLGRIRLATHRTESEFIITISDNGPGMPPNVRDRVFDPFFTTKEVGKGTGQGLNIAHTVIVAKHDGWIDLDTAPGQGARFTIHLPLRPRQRTTRLAGE